jgi:hypothetical protein
MNEFDPEGVPGADGASFPSVQLWQDLSMTTRQSFSHSKAALPTFVRPCPSLGCSRITTGNMLMIIPFWTSSLSGMSESILSRDQGNGGVWKCHSGTDAVPAISWRNNRVPSIRELELVQVFAEFPRRAKFLVQEREGNPRKSFSGPCDPI